MKIAIFGDSISQGIGKQKKNYAETLKNKLGYENVEIFNFAYTGTTIKYLFENIDSFGFEYDVAIIAYGNVDAMLRPNVNHKPNFYKYIPRRYKQNGMLNPRPYYSQKLYKKIYQHIDSFFRTLLNKVLLKVQGGKPWVSLEEFYDLYGKCISRLSDNNCKIIAMSTVQVPEKYFPGTNDNFVLYNEKIHLLAMENGCSYIDLYNKLDKMKYFYDDGYHPNELGYNLIAEMIWCEIKRLEFVNGIKK